jgi:hypothetical protein
MKFGLLKSKIEKQLIESYSNGTFKSEMKFFKKLVLENKKIAKLFYLYDELNTNKGMNDDIVNDYINECVTIYENTINNIDRYLIDNLTQWVGGTESENNYQVIDNLFTSNVLNIENKILNRKAIIESLKKPSKVQKEIIELPISTMVNIANKTINGYIESLNESDRQELVTFLSVDLKDMEKEYNLVKEDVLNKLKEHQVDCDVETSIRIDETIKKIQSEKFDKLSFFRLKGLKENL